MSDDAELTDRALFTEAAGPNLETQEVMLPTEPAILPTEENELSKPLAVMKGILKYKNTNENEKIPEKGEWDASSEYIHISSKS